MRYFVIDFETANSKRTSSCALGIVEVISGKIINSWDYLINPEEKFDNFNIYIHGITEDMVKDKPTFPELWPKIKEILENNIIIAESVK